jgi:uncharacterized protein (DUF58 family)
MFDPVVLSRVRHLHLKARILTDALLMGEHRSRRIGQAVEFADYQEYRPGLDLRHLDWRVLARTDKLVVKRFVTETELPCTVVLDLSGDLGTGETGRSALPALGGSKAGTAITLAATLLYFLQRHGEPIGLELVAGQGVRHLSYRPRTGQNQLRALFIALASVRAGGVADLGKALVRAGQATRRRSFVTVVSDGMEEPSSWLPALAAFARRGADLSFVHLYDRAEWQLAFAEPAVLFSPEGGEAIAVDPVGARTTFAEVARDYVNEVKAGVTRFGGRYFQTPTDAPLEDVLRKIVK